MAFVNVLGLLFPKTEEGLEHWRGRGKTMLADEGMPGRVFVLRLERGDRFPGAVEAFALERGIHAGQVLVSGGFDSGGTCAGMLVQDGTGKPSLYLHGALAGGNGGMTAASVPGAWSGAEVIVQEITGISLRRAPGAEPGGKAFAPSESRPVTKVMEKPAPEPTEAGPATIPVYALNAEFA